MQQPPVEEDLRDDHDKPKNPTIFESNSMHMGCFKKLDYMVYYYRIFSKLIPTLFTVSEGVKNQMRIRFAVVTWILEKW